MGRSVVIGVVLLAACGGSKRREPLPEVPIGLTPPSTADVVVPEPSARPTASATSAPNENVTARARALSQRGDNAGARALLEPRVYGGDATTDEINLLRGICKTQHDKACLAKIPAAKK